MSKVQNQEVKIFTANETKRMYMTENFQNKSRNQYRRYKEVTK